jgi:SOS-response transcriptional repressor LexA
MEPVLGDGWLLRVDTSRIDPQAGDIVAVQINGGGGYLGYWAGGDRAALLHEDPAYPPLELWPRCYRVVGTVTAVVDRPILPAPSRVPRS